MRSKKIGSLSSFLLCQIQMWRQASRDPLKMPLPSSTRRMATPSCERFDLNRVHRRRGVCAACRWMRTGGFSKSFCIYVSDDDVCSASSASTEPTYVNLQDTRNIFLKRYNKDTISRSAMKPRQPHSSSLNTSDKVHAVAVKSPPHTQYHAGRRGRTNAAGSRRKRRRTCRTK